MAANQAFKTGWLKDPYDPRDYKATKLLLSAPRVSLPQSVDLRPKMSKVEDQGVFSSCVANTVVGMLEGIQLKAGIKRVREMSRAFIYWNARKYDGLETADAGCFIRSALKSLSEFGVMNERLYPYTDKNIYNAPGKSAFKQGKRNLFTNYFSVDHRNETEMLGVLALGYTIAFGMILTDKFFLIAPDGKLPADFKKGNYAGAHAMLIVGYTPDYFIVRNSWGTAWGENGYWYLDRAFVRDNPNWFADCWTLHGQDGTKYFDDIK
jgi:C1A family cysteine protease